MSWGIARRRQWASELIAMPFGRRTQRDVRTWQVTQGSTSLVGDMGAGGVNPTEFLVLVGDADRQ
jgi:hypothetical protein